MLNLCLLLLFAFSYGLAPLTTVKSPNDRDGLRLYSVLFSYDAPRLDGLEIIRNWAKQELSAVDPLKIEDSWLIGNFAGFPAWLSFEGVRQLRQHNYIRLIAEAQRVGIPPINFTVSTGDPFTSRPDWGQMRSQEIVRDLNTTPTGYYGTPSTVPLAYPSGGAPTTTWNWNGQSYFPNTNPNTPRGTGAHIWVVDTGINQDHQEFKDASGNSRILYQIDCTGYPNPCVPTTVPDANGHGSHTAGSAVGLNRGMAPAATIGSVKVLDDSGGGWSTWVISGVNFACANKVAGKFNVISMSIGGGFDQATNDAVQNAWSVSKVAVVVAAGNQGGDSCGYSPSSASQPAGTTAIITVGATTAIDGRASFSNFGNCTTILAPGVNIHSSFMGASNAYATGSGTSMATPLVAGALAIYGGSHPNFPCCENAKANLYRWATQNVITNALSVNNQFVNARFAATLDEEEEFNSQWMKMEEMGA